MTYPEDYLEQIQQLQHDKAKLEVDLAESDLANGELRRELEPWRLIVKMMRPRSDQESIFESTRRGAAELESLRLENKRLQKVSSDTSARYAEATEEIKHLRAELMDTDIRKAAVAAQKAELITMRRALDYVSDREPYVLAVIRDFRALQTGAGASFLALWANLDSSCKKLAAHKQPESPT